MGEKNNFFSTGSEDRVPRETLLIFEGQVLPALAGLELEGQVQMKQKNNAGRFNTRERALRIALKREKIDSQAVSENTVAEGHQ